MTRNFISRVGGWRVLVVLTLAMSAAALTLAREASATDVGVGRRAAAIAEIDPRSAVSGCTEVRSVASQEGEPGRIDIRDARSGRSLGRATTTGHGQYAVQVRPLRTGEVIEAVNSRTGFVSSGVRVVAEAAPAIDEPVRVGATTVRGTGTPGHRIEIVHAVTGSVLGTAAAAIAGNGRFQIRVPPLPVFHRVQPVDVTAQPVLRGRVVSILELPRVLPSPARTCTLGPRLPVGRGYQATVFRCQIPSARGLTFGPDGAAYVVAGLPPADLTVVPPLGIFRFSLSARTLTLFAPVTGVALKTPPDFGPTLFLARPRLFRLATEVVIDREDGEVFAVDLQTREVRVHRRLLEIAPSGIAFDSSPDRAFAGDLLVSSFLGDRIVRIHADREASTLVEGPVVSGVQGLAIGPGGAFGSDLYAAQPGSGSVLRISPRGVVTAVVAGLVSPVDVAFGRGGSFGSDLYVTDAGSGTIQRVRSDGQMSMVAGGLGVPFGLAFDASGTGLLVSDYRSGDLVHITATGRVRPARPVRPVRPARPTRPARAPLR